MKKLATWIALGVFACAGEGDIDRTQPNKLPKSLFQGTWYIRSTVTDVPSTSAAGFVGIDSDLEKIVWEIQEDYLIAWRAYEELPGADRQRIDAGKTRPFETVPAQPRDVGRMKEFGDNPIMAFSISSHFDVKRNYNAATGEQTNVIDENSTDRPWYEREYIRVDWSDQQLHWGFRYFEDASVDAQYYVQSSEGGEDAFRILGKDDAGADLPLDFDNVLDSSRPDPGSAYYMDMVGRLLVEPAMGRFYVGGGQYREFPLCYYIPMYNPVLGVSCGPTYMEFRTAFLKVDDEKEGYEPLVMDDPDLGRFGYFRTERFSYNRQRGFTESGRIYLGNRHNIWERSYECEEECVEGEGDSCVTACARDEEGRIIWATNEVGDKISIPMEGRTPKPVVYHLSPSYPEELLDITKKIGNEWNQTLRRAVAAAKGCISGTSDILPEAGSGDGGQCDIPDMFRLHGNGWLDAGSEYLNYATKEGPYTYDPQRTIARLGDLRFSFLAWVDNYHTSSPHGFGPSNADPETGQIISGNAWVYGSVTDRVAMNALDIVRVLNGDLDIDDLVQADHVRAQIEANMHPTDPRDLPAEVANLPSGEMGKFLLGEAGVARMAEVQQLLRDGMLDANPYWEEERLDLVRDTPLEQWMLNDELARELLMGFTDLDVSGPTLPPLDEDTRAQIDPLFLFGPQMKKYEEYRLDWASRHNIWLAEFSDNAVLGLAMQYKDRTDYDQIWKELRDAIYQDVMLHEIGHTVGLRHNFAGSYDSLNYDDRYWELREENLLHMTADSYTLADKLDQFNLTPTQVAEKMPEYQYSSVMDYGARFNSQNHGLGKYDDAAVLFGYADRVEAFDSESFAQTLTFPKEDDVSRFASDLTTQQKGVIWRRLADCTAPFEARTTPWMRSLQERYHYTQVPDLLFVPSTTSTPSPSPYNPSEGIRHRKYVKWSELRPLVDDATQRCKDLVEKKSKGLCDAEEYYYGGTECGSLVSNEWDLVDEGERPIMVPYQFCGDEYAGGSQACYRWDHGADPYEQTWDQIQYYKNYYWFNSFKRDRVQFSPRSVYGRAQRTFGYFNGVYQQYLFNSKWDSLLDDYWLMALYAGFNTLLDVVTTPEYGVYELDDTEQVWELAGDYGGDPDTAILLDRGPAKRTWTDYTWDDGYRYYYQPREVGHFYDFLAGTQALAAVVATGVNTDSGNFGAYYLPYYLNFPSTLHRYSEGIYAEAFDQFAPRMMNGRPEPVQRSAYVDGTYVDPITWQAIPAAEGGYPIETMASFSFRYYQLLYGMAFYPIWDNEYLYRNRVAVAGSGEDLSPGPGYEVKHCTDPDTGVQYSAACDPDESDDLATGACKMIVRCQQFAAGCESGDVCGDYTCCSMLDSQIFYLDIQRSVYGVFNQGYW